MVLRFVSPTLTSLKTLASTQIRISNLLTDAEHSDSPHSPAKSAQAVIASRIGSLSISFQVQLEVISDFCFPPYYP